MEGVAIIEGKALGAILNRLENIEQAQLALMKMIQRILPPLPQSSVPEFISLDDAAKKYHVTKTTLQKKLDY